MRCWPLVHVFGTICCHMCDAFLFATCGHLPAARMQVRSAGKLVERFKKSLQESTARPNGSHAQARGTSALQPAYPPAAAPPPSYGAQYAAGSGVAAGGYGAAYPSNGRAAPPPPPPAAAAYPAHRY